MTDDSETNMNYGQVLRQLQADLDGLDGRRQALLASIAAIRRLVDPEDEVITPQQFKAYPAADAPPPKMPVIPPGFFSGKTPTQGYRELLQMWPGYYTPPQIADLFMHGGMTHKTRTDLVQAIHSVIKRERKRLRGSLELPGNR